MKQFNEGDSCLDMEVHYAVNEHGVKREFDVSTEEYDHAEFFLALNWLGEYSEEVMEED